MTEPGVHHHGREGDGAGHEEVRPSAFNGLLGSQSTQSTLGIRRQCFANASTSTHLANGPLRITFVGEPITNNAMKIWEIQPTDCVAGKRVLASVDKVLGE